MEQVSRWLREEGRGASAATWPRLVFSPLQLRVWCQEDTRAPLRPFGFKIKKQILKLEQHKPQQRVGELEGALTKGTFTRAMLKEKLSPRGQVSAGGQQQAG